MRSRTTTTRAEGLGYELAAEVKQTLGRVVQFPDAWHPLSPRTRRCRTKRFPYAVVYQVRDDLVLVVAIMHLRQHPGLLEEPIGIGREINEGEQPVQA